MRKLILLILAILATQSAFGQKTESYLSLNSGLFSFRGVSAERTSQINLASNGASGYTNNPFGAQGGLSYGLSHQIQRVTRHNFILGVSLGYENLRSKTTISSVNGYSPAGTYQQAASGQTYLANQFINGFPYAGFRTTINQLSVDLTAGFDIGYLVRSAEHGKAISTTGETYNTSVDRTGIRSDIRPRVQITASYGRAGLYLGYARGLANYRSGWVGGKNECSSELIRFGLTFKLKGA